MATLGKQTKQPKVDKAKLDHQLTAQEQEHASKVLVDEATKTHAEAARKAVEDSDDAKIASEAVEIAELLGQDAEFNEEMNIAIRAKEDDDYKSLATLKLMERLLSAEQFARLPRVGSKSEEVLARITAGSNEPKVWDHLKIPYINDNGEHKSRATTYYTELARALPQGKQATDVINGINSKRQDNTRSEDVEPDIANLKSANRALNQMKIAVRQAARIRKQLDMFTSLRKLEFSWARGPYEGNDEPPADNTYDPTKLIIKGKGDVIKSTACIAIRNITETPKRWAYFGIGPFLNWKLDNPDVIRKQTIQSLKDSAKRAPQQQAQATTTGTVTLAKAKRYEQTSLSDAMDALEHVLMWYDGQSPSDQQLNYKTVVGAIEHSDEHNATLYRLYQILRPRYESDPNARKRAEAFINALENNKNKKQA